MIMPLSLPKFYLESVFLKIISVNYIYVLSQQKTQKKMYYDLNLNEGLPPDFYFLNLSVVVQ